MKIALVLKLDGTREFFLVANNVTDKVIGKHLTKEGKMNLKKDQVVRIGKIDRSTHLIPMFRDKNESIQALCEAVYAMGRIDQRVTDRGSGKFRD